jgi:hypothetical protein
VTRRLVELLQPKFQDKMTDRKPVAIIAIHGVGDQAPCETARHLMQHLMRTNADDVGEPVTHPGFEEHSIVLPVLPIRAELNIDPPDRDNASRKSSMLNSTSEFLRSDGATTHAETIDTDFTRSLINEYDASTDAPGYHTIMLEGTRKRANAPDQPIHIYEMYWGDLSRLGGGMLAVLGELYQLLLHAGSIARTTADMQWAAAKRNKLSAPLLPLLAIFRWLVGSTIWLSTVPLVAVNFMLVATALTLVPLTVPVIAKSPLANVAGYAMAAASLTALFFVLRVYNARRPGALWWGIAVACVGIAVAVWRISVGDDYRATVLSVAEIIFHLLWPLALLIIDLIVFCLIFAVLCVAFKRQARERAATIPRGIITAVTAVVVPLSLSCVITVLLWAGSAAFLKSALKEDVGYKSVMPEWTLKLPFYLQPSTWPSDSLEKICTSNKRADSQTCFVEHLLAHGGSESFNWMIAGMALALVFLVLGTIASIKDELSPPMHTAGKNQRWLKWGGIWLNAGLTWVPMLALFVLILFSAAAMLIPIVVGCVDGVNNFWCGNNIVSVLGLFVTASSAGILALGKAYNRGLGALRPGLDLALDVDNWLRERPKKSNPRARILSRYLAILKHLKEHGYERIVIVAHSQGTVITADLLRLLKTSNWQDQFTIRLLTLGSPLRQLYAERFPDLYGWVTNSGGPEPSQLHGVTYWLNGYRSGDYVGRALWQDLIASPQFVAGPSPETFVSADLKNKKQFGEFCVGAGGHTHYFDYTAPDVAVAIDLLIAD